MTDIEIELRDWFAGQALIGLLGRVGVSYPGETSGERENVHEYRHDTPSLGNHAYQIADAMMEWRIKSREKASRDALGAPVIR